MNQNFKMPRYRRSAKLTDLVRGATVYVESPIKKGEFVKTTFGVNFRREDWLGLIAKDRVTVEITLEEFQKIFYDPEPAPKEEPPSNQINLF